MKVLAFLMLAGGACLLLATGNFHLSFNTGSDPGPNAVAATSTQGPVVRDVLAVVDAATTADAARDTQALQGLIGRAHSAGIGGGAILLERQLPALQSRIERDVTRIRGEVRDVDVTTRAGHECRLRTVELLTRQRELFRSFAAEVANHQAWAAVSHMQAASDVLNRWYANQLDSCTSTATPADRSAIKAALHG